MAVCVGAACMCVYNIYIYIHIYVYVYMYIEQIPFFYLYLGGFPRICAVRKSKQGPQIRQPIINNWAAVEELT